MYLLGKVLSYQGLLTVVMSTIIGNVPVIIVLLR